jgi:NADH-quinone oxidoreductase subunit E
MLSPHEKEEIQKEIALYPYARAACIDALKVVQEHRGWISDEAIKDVAEELSMSVTEVDSIATFYTRLYRKPVGRNVILICDSVSCMVMGYETVYKRIADILSIRFGETTADGRFTLLPISCLGDCDHAPSLMINNDLYHDIAPDQVQNLLDRYK